ncbi:HAMP domain-containing sensor histidine kinase [Antrihabitans cavernicola]|uniref:histidine kinase n=1 Tax=Antrihabitans cavernicola TaxID=2495913 RepID=A0A5A7SHD4_9NOCA|nr:histidine kinase [Spelaeibacter cavernicola]KAA0024819.1 HAMP domain-containing protein [Spelaeibacter cavernicola]
MVTALDARSTQPARALFRRMFVINGLVFTIGTLVLALSPATVSAPINLTEIPVLLIGLTIIVATNALLVRRSLAPLEELTGLMQRVDLLRTGVRIDDKTPRGDLTHLIQTFNAMLDRLEAERTASSAHALAAQEGERQRIARELHDEIGQSLTVVLLGLKHAVDRAPAELRPELHAVQETVRSSLDEVRQVAHRLRPGVLADLGLHSALSSLSSEFSRISGIPVTRRVDPGPLEVGNDVELVVYRIAQESFTNVTRHAHASAVELRLTKDPTALTLRVVDDGIGGVRHDGAGIRGMRERALLVDAELTITSPADGGTEVRLDVPNGKARA